MCVYMPCIVTSIVTIIHIKECSMDEHEYELFMGLIDERYLNGDLEREQECLQEYIDGKAIIEALQAEAVGG